VRNCLNSLLVHSLLSFQYNADANFLVSLASGQLSYERDKSRRNRRPRVSARFDPSPKFPRFSTHAIAVLTSHLCSENPVPQQPNVVIFGESGSGKSSIVNMLAGKEVVVVNAGASGTNFQHKGCAIMIGDKTVNVYDTSGLELHESGVVVTEDTWRELIKFLHDLGEINLLIFVIRFRLTERTIENYYALRSVFGESKVPMVVAITGQEFRDSNEWWSENEQSFVDLGVDFAGFAIGTANGKLSSDKAYSELLDELRRLICSHCDQHPFLKLDPLPSRTDLDDAVKISQADFHRMLDSSMRNVQKSAVPPPTITKENRVGALRRSLDHLLQAICIRTCGED
jgi:GTP-binding protein EngB required for normal cell division